MSHRFYPIVLHRKEWERLKRQSGPLITETVVGNTNTREEYFDALNEQSQKWIKLWPDSAEGLREKQKQLTRKQRKDNLALVDAFKKSKKHEDRDKAVKRAKQIIFDDSCYGRQLISAINESNILEEREAQIEFKKEIMQKESEIERSKTYGDSPLVFDEAHERMEAERKLAAIECVKFNEEIELEKKQREAKLKAEKILCGSVDEDMGKQIKEIEAKKKAEMKLLVKKGIEEYEEITKVVKKQRQMNEDRDNALIEVYKEEQDRMRCKVEKVLRNIIEEKRHGEHSVKINKAIEELQKADEKRYNDFVKKGINMHEQRYEEQEAKELDKQNKKREERYKISKENQIAAEQHKLCRELTAPGNKCACDTQTILVKPNAEKPPKKLDVKTQHDFERGTQSSGFIEKDDSKKVKFPFLKPSKKLVEDLKKRAKESSGYTGTEGADKYFAEQASDALQRTKHKYFARKVVDEYLKVNCLDASKLSISNY